MSTKYNLNIDTRTNEGDPSGDGVTQNTSIRSDDPSELIAILKQLSGMDSAEHSHEEPSAAHVQVTSHEQPADAMRAIMQKSGLGSLPVAASVAAPAAVAMMEADKVDEALANAPRPKTMKSLLDIVNTDHTAKAPTNPVPAKSGDNPLASHDEELMESRLMREWQETKVQNYVESFDVISASIALAEGRKSFVVGTKEYAIRESGEHRMVYPIIDNRVMTQVPVYVAESAGVPISDERAAQMIARKIQGTPNLSIPTIEKYVVRYLDMVGKNSTDVKHLVALVHSELDAKGLLETPNWDDPDTKKFYDKPAAQRMASGETEPVDTTDYDIPPAMRKDAKRAKDLGRLYGKKFGHDSLEEEKDIAELSLFRLWNLHANSLVMSSDPYVSSQISDDAKRVKSDIEAHVRNEYSPAVLHDMTQYSRHMMSYEMNPERNEEELERATSIARRYNFNSNADHEEPADSSDDNSDWDEEGLDNLDLSKDKLKPNDKRIPPIMRKQATEGVTEAKKKAKNKYAIGMAAAMKTTGDKPPLKKSTITKAHEIAKAVKEGSKKK